MSASLNFPYRLSFHRKDIRCEAYLNQKTDLFLLRSSTEPVDCHCERFLRHLHLAQVQVSNLVLTAIIKNEIVPVHNIPALAPRGGRRADGVVGSRPTMGSGRIPREYSNLIRIARAYSYFRHLSYARHWPLVKNISEVGL